MGFSDNGVRGSLSVTVPDAPQYDLSRGGSSRQRSLSSVSSDSAEDTLQGLSSSPELSGASIARGQNATLDGLLQDNLSPRKVFISSKNERRLSLENKAKRPKFSLSSLWPFRKKRSKMAADRVFYPVR